MFDVDCSNLGVSVSASPVGPYPKHASHGGPYPKHASLVGPHPKHASPVGQHHKYASPVGLHLSQQHHNPPTTHPYLDVNTDPENVCVRPPQYVDNCEVTTAYSKPRAVSLAFYSLLRGDTIKRLYMLAMCAGVVAVAINVPNQKRMLLSFALFQGVFIPGVVLHSILMLHSMPAMFSVVLFLLFAPLGVPLGIMYETHIFISSSIVMAATFHLVAGGGGMVRILYIMGLLLFSCISFEGVVDHNPEQPLVQGIVPLVQIIYVCVSGVASVNTGIKAGNCDCLVQPGFLKRWQHV